MHYNVAIIGGGPGGSTCGGFLRKYAPSLTVGIFERDVFPRDHIGESQLPTIMPILDELGIWDRMEAADFPIKVGAIYRWGNTNDLWAFNFLANAELAPEPRPAKYDGQRLRTAWQVDRAIYDKILLDFAKETGCDVHEGTGVASVERDGDCVLSLTLKSGEKVTADYFIDASGHSGFLRRAMGVPIETPTNLQNVAFWDYWQNAEWAEKIGVGGTRIQVMSLGYGWIWFIPIGPTRTSCGFVCPAEYYKKSGLKPEELYRKALAEEPRITGLLSKATSEDKFTATKDWSFISERLTGENWMLVGEAAGFADPILSAGLTLTHVGAREAAHSLIEILLHKGDKDWIFEEYDARNRRRIMQHIRFADYWYTNNEHFSDLKEFTRTIASDAGLDLDAESAFQWLGTGGFVDEDLFVGGLGTFTFNALHEIAKRLSKEPGSHAYGGFNTFKLNLRGSRKVVFPLYRLGRVERVQGWERDGKVLPVDGMVGLLVKGLQETPILIKALSAISRQLRVQGMGYDKRVHDAALQTLEALIRDEWVTCSVTPGFDLLSGDVVPGSLFVQDQPASV